MRCRDDYRGIRSSEMLAGREWGSSWYSQRIELQREERTELNTSVSPVQGGCDKSGL